MDDIADHAQAIFIIGSNTTENHPVFGAKIRQAVLKRNARLIIADPRRIDITELADEHIQHNPGTDIALINGLMNIILENNWQDEDFIQQRTEGFNEFRKSLALYPPYEVSKLTGVPLEQLYRTAEIMANSKPMAVIWAMGITQHTTGTLNVITLANLQMLLGNIGVPGGGANPLRGQNNVQGACDLGGLPDVYPGYRKVNIPEHQKFFEEAWGTELSENPGLPVTEVMPAILEDKIKALYIIAENPLMSDPDTNHVKKCLNHLDFMVLQEIFPSESSKYADVLLPGTTFAEKEGSFTNTERRIQKVRKAIEPLEGTKADWVILSEIARRIQNKSELKMKPAPYSGWDYKNPRDIMQEIAALTPIYAGVSYERLDKGERLQWPLSAKNHPGTPILHKDKFSRGKGRFIATDYLPPAEVPDHEYPFVLSTGRVLYHWHGGEMTRRSKGLLEVYDHALIEINPLDAARFEIKNQEKVHIVSRRGDIQAEAWVTDRVPEGMIFSNFHFPESGANQLTIAALDPIAKIPEYKICAVKIERV